MVQRVIEIGRQVGTPTGMHVMDAASALERAEQGMQFLAIGSDLRLMLQSAQQVVRTLYPERHGEDVVPY